MIGRSSGNLCAFLSISEDQPLFPAILDISTKIVGFIPHEHRTFLAVNGRLGRKFPFGGAKLHGRFLIQRISVVVSHQPPSDGSVFRISEFRQLTCRQISQQLSHVLVGIGIGIGVFGRHRHAAVYVVYKLIVIPLLRDFHTIDGEMDQIIPFWQERCVGLRPGP